MLNDLLNNLQSLKNEADIISNLPKEQQEEAAASLAEKVLNILENANITIPKEHSNSSGGEILPSEF